MPDAKTPESDDDENESSSGEEMDDEHFEVDPEMAN